MPLREYVSCSLEPTQSLAAGIYNPYVTTLHPSPPRIPMHCNNPLHLHYQLNGEEAKELFALCRTFSSSLFKILPARQKDYWQPRKTETEELSSLIGDLISKSSALKTHTSSIMKSEQVVFLYLGRNICVCSHKHMHITTTKGK